MSDQTRIQTPDPAVEAERPPLVALPGGEDPASDPQDPRPPRPKIRWLRLLALLSGLGVLALVSTVFGMMMAVASDLPGLDVFHVDGNPSRILDRDGKELGQLTGNTRRVLVSSEDIAPVMKQAIVAIEDRRFNTNSGVDLRGIARALWQDIVQQRVVQGGSTITQQLVKNRLEAQNDRTLFQKMREAAIAVHMTREWDKSRILQNYLNTIYFGNGAYGIEAAARTYFGKNHGCASDGQPRCAEQLEPHEAALLAGIVASPSAYDPIAHPVAATQRRNLVLQRMQEQGYLSPSQVRAAAAEPVPTTGDIAPPREESRYPYFTTWVRQQVVDAVGASAAFEGGLEVKTTLDSEIQEAAHAAVRQWLGPNVEPASALVAIDNDTSEVLAMVGGPLPQDPRDPAQEYNQRPFNLATQGQRQPGSAFKPFTLAAALQKGVRPDSLWSSRKKYFCVDKHRGKCREWFEVNNYEDRYAGSSTLASATAFSDNSVYAELGIKVGGKRVKRGGREVLEVPGIARIARRMGIRTDLSTNPAITLGGLEEGVTVLDMAHAYQTIARNGQLIYGTLSPGAKAFAEDKAHADPPGPLGLKGIEDGDEPARGRDGEEIRNDSEEERVFSAKVADQMKGMLAGVVRSGTGTRATLGPDVVVMGKTGTTEDYGDAWFVGFTGRFPGRPKGITVAVWVGFPDEVKPMKPPVMHFNGDPVAGGTYPAAIWQSFMKSVVAISQAREDAKKPKNDPNASPTPGGALQTAPSPAATRAPSGSRDGSRRPRPQRTQPDAERQATGEPEPEAQPEEPPPATGEGGAESPEDGTGEPDD